MEMVTIEVRLPKEIYDKASEILARQGLTMEDALIPRDSQTRTNSFRVYRRRSRRSQEMGEDDER